VKGKFEYAYWQSVFKGLTKPKVPVTPYIPQRRQPPSRSLEVVSAWEGIQNILADLIQRFDIDTNRCLEFGVEYGFSTVALSSFFNAVTGVDTFQGDRHTTNKSDIYSETSERLSCFANINLICSDYRDFIQQDHGSYGLIHVDIIHTFADTFACGLWSANHSQCTIFHDTESFPQVKQAVTEIARATGKKFYNFNESSGLGILV
jgi:Methyltransferase domain